MMRVMIVDDEKLIRDGLAHLVDWGAFNCAMVAEAADGLQALEYLQDHEIDLVFTDIRMPRLDGMEFARQLREKQPMVKIVFVSGYDDFSLVRRALQMGACDYLLKPLDPDVLTELLSRLSKEADAQPTLSPEEIERLSKDAVIAKRHRIQRVFRRAALVKRPLPAEDIELLRPETGKGYRLILVEIDRFYARYASLSAEQLGLMQDRISETLQEMCGEDAIIFSLGDARYGICLYDKEHVIREKGDRLLKQLDRVPETGDSLLCFDGGQTVFPEDIAGLYSNALQKREGSYAPLDAEEGNHKFRHSDEKLNSAVAAVLDALRLGDGMLLRQRVQELKTLLAGEGERSFLYAQVTFGSLFAQAIQCVANEGGSISEVFDDPIGEYRAVYSGQTLDQAAESMLRILEGIADYLSMSRSGSATAQIRKAKRFIDSHLGDAQLSMQRVADEFAMSASYFSTEFRKTVGYTFTEYLMMARIQRAGELLKHSKLKVYEIAESLGYENTTYFSTLFKRQYGVTPKQYRGDSQE